MPTYQTLLPNNIYPFLDSMAALYSQLERDMHSCLMGGEKINVIEKSLQSKYKVDSTTVRNVYQNLKGKHSSLKELRKIQAKELKSSIRSIQTAIKKRQKKKQLSQKELVFIHQKKRRLLIKRQKLEKLTGLSILSKTISRIGSTDFHSPRSILNKIYSQHKIIDSSLSSEAVRVKIKISKYIYHFFKKKLQNGVRAT